MNILKRIYLTGAVAMGCLCLPVLQSCTDELKLDSEGYPGEDFTGITLFIPNARSAAEFGATRDDGNINPIAYELSREANFNTLYIVAVDDNGGIHTSLKTQPNGIVEQNYNRYLLSLAPDKYKFYVVANLNRYLFDNGKTTTFYEKVNSENDIRNLILNFSSDIPLEPGFLPMACLNEAIKVGPNKSEAKNRDEDTDHTYFDENGYINVSTGDNIYIYADLKYLCAKVRYTILFDRSKSDFGTNDVIDIHRSSHEKYPYVTNLRKYTSLYASYVPPVDEDGTDGQTEIKDFTSFITQTSGENTVVSNWAIPLERYKYGNFDFYDPTKSDEYVIDALKSLQLWTSSDGAWTSGTYKDKRAWQGIAYIPENLLDENPTLLKFPYSFNNNEGNESPRTIELKWQNEEDGTGIQRSKLYDVYALIKTPDPEQWSVEVLPQEWTFESLVYELHGPYELIVETTQIPKLSMQEDIEFWFKTDIDPEEIKFESPQVSKSNEAGKDMVDLFKGRLVRDADGNPARNGDGAYLYHVGLNLEIPYAVLDNLCREGGWTIDGVTYSKKDISYFHLVAGSIHKRIDIIDLDLDPYLEVTPQTVIIDTRELYTSGYDERSYPITFETNVDIRNAQDIYLTLSDPSGLISAEGMGEGALLINNPGKYVKTGSVVNITDKTGVFNLLINKIVEGSPYWNLNNEYTLTFKLSAKRVDGTVKVVEKTVNIKVRPFSGNYVIHFRDNTKPWAVPHIWVYQLLTLPADLPAVAPGSPGYDPNQLHEYAGRIVGYIENNPTSGLQWNGSAQYVFSNNVSFKGWKGYGGPADNDPWAVSKCTYFDPIDDGTNRNSNNSTMGFVMFGTAPESDGSWNFDYSYLADGGKKRYNYDINFNADHEATGFSRWSCQTCKDMSPDFNGGNNDRFYTGIAMEKEEGENEGWYKYTLSGVAQSGRTMIVFANWHEPWMEAPRDYAAEDNRWPGDYETGIPLFDFEDNEGWLLFDGNTTNSEQKFVDDKPVSKVIPHNFNSSITDKMRIGIKVPSSSTTISGVTANGKAGTLAATDAANNIRYYDFTSVGGTSETMSVKVTVGSTTKTYTVSPKFFKKSASDGYESAQPLYLEFCKEVKLFVKWNDNVNLDSGWGGDYAYYTPPTGGSDWLALVWSNDRGTIMRTDKRVDKIYGNYKHVIVNCLDPTSSVTGAKDRISLRLCTTASGTGNFHQNLKVEDLPKYYNPSEGYYQINWHMFGKPVD